MPDDILQARLAVNAADKELKLKKDAEERLAADKVAADKAVADKAAAELAAKETAALKEGKKAAHDEANKEVYRMAEGMVHAERMETFHSAMMSIIGLSMAKSMVKLNQDGEVKALASHIGGGDLGLIAAGLVVNPITKGIGSLIYHAPIAAGSAAVNTAQGVASAGKFVAENPGNIALGVGVAATAPVSLPIIAAYKTGSALYQWVNGARTSMPTEMIQASECKNGTLEFTSLGPLLPPGAEPAEIAAFDALNKAMVKQFLVEKWECTVDSSSGEFTDRSGNLLTSVDFEKMKADPKIGLAAFAKEKGVDLNYQPPVASSRPSI